MNQKKSSTMVRFLCYLEGYWQAYTVGGLYLSFIEAAAQILVALLIKSLVDASLTGDLSMLLNSMFVFGLSLLALAVFYPGARRISGRAVEMATTRLRQDLFEHIQTLPMSYHERVHSGDSVARLTNDVNMAKEAISTSLFTVISLVLSAIASTIYMGLINWKFVIVALVIVGMSVLHNRLTGAPMRRVSAAVQGSLATLNGRLKDMLTGMPVIRAFNLEQHFVDRYAAANAETQRLGMQLVQKQVVNSTGNSLFGTATFLGMLAFGSYLMLRGEITPGDAVAAVQLCNGISNPIRALGDLWAALQSSLGAADRVFAILDEPAEQLQVNTEASAELSQASMVSLRNVSFAYDEQQQVLTDVNLDVDPGSVIALAGPSGGGKSTIFKLLLGFYQANAGECLLMGRPLGSYSLEELREQIAFVPQDSYLFAGTIYDNIAYGRPGATTQEIIAAAQAANAHDFIVSMPEGYETQVGERGAQLSGGQRQRIAIARALLKDAPLLLLDEATSSLDSEAEHLVQEALARLMQGRTTLVIAHRLSTIENADFIHVIADGSIVESGTHQELLQLDGVYRKLYEIQLRAA